MKFIQIIALIILATNSLQSLSTNPTKIILKDISDRQCNTEQFHTLFRPFGSKYDIEEHEVTTDDGYVLKIFRVTLSAAELLTQNIQKKSSVIYLQHGVLDSSDAWFLHHEDKSIGFYLLSHGYELWVGNNRGNKYSHTHINKDIPNAEYYNYSFTEMGQFDIPAFYKHILKKTGADKITFIGHSQGTTQMFAALTDPENPSNTAFVASKTERFIAFSPIVFMSREGDGIISTLSRLSWPLQGIIKTFGLWDLFPSDCQGSTLFKKVLTFICQHFGVLCDNMPVVPINPKYDAYLDDIPFTLSHYPAGISAHAL